MTVNPLLAVPEHGLGVADHAESRNKASKLVLSSISLRDSRHLDFKINQFCS